VTKRQEFGNRVSSVLSEVEGLQTPMIVKENTSVYAQYTILCEQRETIQSVLKEKDIPSVSYYTVPLHMQPVFQNLGYKTGDFPVAERIADQCLSLPMSPYLSDGDQNKVIEGIRDSATSSSG
jgi:UDP-2-acetamido-2-deoxy-ribo-hexuluronate aminotransferase